MGEEEIREDREVLYTCAFSIVSVGDMGKKFELCLKNPFNLIYLPGGKF